MSAHPTQPVVWDGRGVTRFKQNDIVEFLLWFASWRGMSLNEIAGLPNEIGVEVPAFSADDWMQFQQLTGYSVSGWADLIYVSNAARRKAAAREATLLAGQPTDPGTATWYRPEYPLPHERKSLETVTIARLKQELAEARARIGMLREGLQSVVNDSEVSEHSPLRVESMAVLADQALTEDDKAAEASK
jgi:hypothetical protein